MTRQSDNPFTADAVIDNGSVRHPHRSGSRPAASPARPPAPSSPTSTTTPCCCRPPRPASTPRSTSTSSRSRWTSRSGCTPPGRIPGSFFRREGRPSEDAILTCRLIDRPLRPSFVKGLRNEVQVVITVMALNPNDLYDVVAINAASASTQLAGLPFSGPIGAIRVALIDGQWVAFPTHEQLETAVFDMVVAGRVVGDDVAIMMVEAEATTAAWHLIKDERQDRADRGGRRRRASRPPSRSSGRCARRSSELAARGRQADRASSRSSSTTRTTSSQAVTAAVSERARQALTIADKQERETELDRIKDAGQGEARQPVRGPREGDQRRLPRR